MNLPEYSPTNFALKIFLKRYIIHPEETFSKACNRVGVHIASPETNGKRQKYAERFTKILVTNRFSCGGRIWRGCGRPKGQLLNCFVLPAEDSREGWGNLLKNTVIISGLGGGIGINFSHIRPRGTEIKGTGGIATGAVSLMEITNAVGDVIREGGGRRTALMFGLMYNHPDLREFIDKKLNHDEINNANVSVMIDNNFLDLVENDGDVIFEWQGQEKGKMKARKIWKTIVENAWKCGDPGILNYGLANELNTVSYLSDLDCTNPSLAAMTLVATQDGIFPIEDLQDKKFQIKSLDGKWQQAECFLSSEAESLMEIHFGNHKIVKCTKEHKWPIIDQFDRIHRIRSDQLLVGDNIPLNRNKTLGINNNDWSYDEGFAIGYIAGDGWITQRKNHKFCMGIVFNSNENDLADRLLNFINTSKKNRSNITVGKKDKCLYIQTTDQKFINDIINKYGIDIKKQHLPKKLWQSNDQFILGYIDGLLSSDGSVSKENNKSPQVLLTTSRKNIAIEFCKLLSFYGIYSSVNNSKRKISFNKKEEKLYSRWNVVIPFSVFPQFDQVIKISHKNKQLRFQYHLNKINTKQTRKSLQKYAKITKIKYNVIKEKVWDIKVYGDEHIFPCQYSYTGNCGEQFLEPYGSCCLGSIVLSTHVVDNDIDWELLGDTITLAVRFLDNVISVNHYPIKEVEQQCQNVRRIGLGVMGLHDMLLKMGLKYDQPKSLEFVDKLFNFIKKKSYEASIFLSVEKGQFPLLNRELHIKSGFVKTLSKGLRQKILEYGIRNCTINTIPPTGTTSIVAAVSSGIEPMFSYAYERSWVDDIQDSKGKGWARKNKKKEIVIHPLFQEFIDAGKSVKNFQSAHEISPAFHLELQQTCQRHIDNAITKTINIPSDISVNELSESMLKHARTLKGITVYRDGSKGEAPLIPIDLNEAIEHAQKNKGIVAAEGKRCEGDQCEL